MTSRFPLLPDARFERLSESLRDRIREVADSVDAPGFATLLDPVIRQVFQGGLTAAGAHEGTIWIADAGAERLVMGYNTGPNAQRLVGTFYQPIFGEVGPDGLTRPPGIVSGVFQREQAFCENEVHRNAQQDSTLDRSLAVLTVAMVAVPFYFAGEKRGVVSAVQLMAPSAVEEPPGFPMESVMHVQLAADVVGRLIDHWLVGRTTAWLAE